METFLWGTLVILATAGLGYLGNRLHISARKRRWRSTAREFGLRYDDPWRITGTVGDLVVRVEQAADAADTRLSLRGPGQLSVLMQPRTFLRGKTDRGQWDDAFEDRYVVTGRPEHTLALLGADLRQAFVDSAWPRWTLDMSAIGEAGGFRLETTVSGDFAHVLRPLLKDLIALGRRVDEAARPLTRGAPPDRKTALIARLRDPSPRVRLRVIAEMSTWSNTPPEVDRALEALLVDRDLAVRLSAAALLKRSDVMVAIAEDPEAPMETRLEAFRRALRYPTEDHQRQMVRSWAMAHDLSRRLEGLAAIPSVTDSVEPWVLEVLSDIETAPDEKALIKAFHLLAWHGTALSVPRLMPYRERLWDSPLRVAATDAIRAIQARTGASQGALALAVEGGWLSEPE